MSNDLAIRAAKVAKVRQGMIGNTNPTHDQEVKDQRMKQTADEIEQMCLSEGLAVKMKVHPRNTCPHPDNRSGGMLDPVDAHGLLVSIFGHGFSYRDISRTWAFEKPVGEQATQYEESVSNLI